MDLTLREKLGQMLMAGFPGTDVPPEFERLVREFKIGNVVLFSRNMESVPQVRRLCGDLQRLIRECTGRPALIAVDQEGGMVSRMPPDGTAIPGAMAVAATGNPRNAFEAGRLTAAELHAMGINVDIAPVMDINGNPDNPVIGVRSYGDRKETVAEYGIAMMKGLRSGGVMPVLKHFPGHGDTSVDSHLDLPTVGKTAAELETSELVPFRAAIREGAECVMTSHILFPAFEEQKLPATMSRAILTGLLRGKIGFDGIIMTDCLEMNAIREYYGTAEGALAAIRAGADLAVVSHTASLAEEAARRLEAAVRSGELDRRQVDESVERILRAKRRCADYDIDAADLSVVGCEEHRRIAVRISRESMTLVRGGDQGCVPDGPTLFIGPYAWRTTFVSGDINRDFNFPGYLSARLGGDGVLMSADPGPEEIERLAAQAAAYPNVVVGTYNGHLNPGQLGLVNRICRNPGRVVAVALRNPYDLSRIDTRAAAIALYEYTPLAFDSLARALRGEEAPRGRLSVALPG